MKQIPILGVNIADLSYKETINQIALFIVSKKPHHIVTANPEILMEAQKNKEYKKIVMNANLCLPDGAGLWWASKYQGDTLKHRITGIDLIYEICKFAAKKRKKIFLLGGQNNVAQIAAQNLQDKYSHLKICGTYEGFPVLKKKLSQKEKINNFNIINQVLKAKPDILLVAYGAPKQELFINKYKKELNIPVMIGVGGAFDFISGRIKRAPKWMQIIHLEWLYRLIQQPSRHNRIITATIRFPWKIITTKNN